MKGTLSYLWLWRRSTSMSYAEDLMTWLLFKKRWFLLPPRMVCPGVVSLLSPDRSLRICRIFKKPLALPEDSAVHLPPSAVTCQMLKSLQLLLVWSVKRSSVNSPRKSKSQGGPICKAAVSVGRLPGWDVWTELRSGRFSARWKAEFIPRMLGVLGEGSANVREISD